MARFAPHAKALCKPEIEIPILWRITDHVARSDLAHTVEAKRVGRIISIRHFSQQIGDRPMDQTIGHDSAPRRRLSPLGAILEIDAMAREDRRLDRGQILWRCDHHWPSHDAGPLQAGKQIEVIVETTTLSAIEGDLGFR